MAANKVGRPPSKGVVAAQEDFGGPFHKESEHARKSHAILLAAAQAFVHAGFHNTSLQDIANRLGISKPTLAYYVGSKEEILFKCQHTALEHLKLTIPNGREAEGSGLEQLSEFILHLAEWTASDFARCLVRCQWDLKDEEGLTHLETERRLIDAALQKTLERGLKDGSIRAVYPSMVSAAILGSLNWIATWFDQSRTSRTSRDVGEAFLDLFLHGLQAPTRPKNAGKPHMAVVPSPAGKQRP
jgi:AcrR family transcriptional regulator